MASDLTPDELAALDELLPDELRSGDDVEDLAAAAREALRRRKANTKNGGAVIAALHRQGISWRDLEGLTGIPQRTARRWAEPPEDE